MSNSIYQDRWFAGDYTVNLAAYYLKNWENYKMQVHEHDQAEIMYVIKGRCTIEAEDMTYILTNGGLIFIDANIPHRIIMKDDERCRMLNVEFGFAAAREGLPTAKQLMGEEFTKSRFYSERKTHVVIKDNSDVYSYMTMLINELGKKRDGSGRVIQMQAAQLILKTAELYEDRTSRKNVRAIVHIRHAVDYLYEHYYDEIKAQDIADHVGINVNYLQRIFKTHTDKTVVEFLNEIRIEKAKELLACTDIAVSDLCVYVGINSRQYFSYLFKKHLDISPLDYRNSFLRAKNIE